MSVNTRSAPASVGFLGTDTPATQRGSTVAFADKLRELGWTEDRAVIRYWWAEGQPDRFATLASECVHAPVDVIVTAGTQAVTMAMQSTSAIPIVFAQAEDPVADGLVANLARPGGNVTGVSLGRKDICRRLLETLTDILPSFRRLAILVNGNSPAALLEAGELQVVARLLGIDIDLLDVRVEDAIIPTLEAHYRGIDALYVTSDQLTWGNRDQVLTFALISSLPTVFRRRGFVAAGGLLACGPNYQKQFERAAEFVDRILRGAKPAELPVQRSQEVSLVVNRKTAASLRLELSSLLSMTDDIIE
ncbi:ABC transporter substrate-binding protein [Bradyrhizobium sp. WYCCWR 13023]|uniref:ABC transporter substrate-binding protein n=1 Tax=Bradyrhizobium zhengyangense TaxID=2911009 RepID=A0A9X1R2W4_9BRAD|nr:ABC transporter substrate-binding protein [Bradyrhizobium zhengyangense]MCG2626287.1 ABC transporter substrate-binding protein [Bradyrhizobium zhengyangense]MCG2668295.1 ABC transporter substrate-binding protein [Bradyrhizobium zhengyangense]